MLCLLSQVPCSSTLMELFLRMPVTGDVPIESTNKRLLQLCIHIEVIVEVDG